METIVLFFATSEKNSTLREPRRPLFDFFEEGRELVLFLLSSSRSSYDALSDLQGRQRRPEQALARPREAAGGAVRCRCVGHGRNRPWRSS